MSEDWLPEDLRTDTAVNKFKDVSELAKAYKEVQSFMGNSLRIPGENAAEADRNAFYEKLRTKVPDLVPVKDEKAVSRAFGVPEKPEEYTVPEEAQFSPEEAKAWQERAKELGLSKKQAEAVLKTELQQRTSTLQAVKDNLVAIEKEWGAATKDRLENIAKVAERFGYDADWIKGIREGKVPLNALTPFQKMVDALGKEGSELGKNQGKVAGPVTPAEAERQIAELSRNPAFLNAKDPMHSHLQKEFLRLVALSQGLDKLPDPYMQG